MKIIKEEIQFEESLKQRLEFICEFSKVNPTFIKEMANPISTTIAMIVKSNLKKS